MLIIATLILIFAPGNAARAKTDYQYIEGFASLPIAGHIKLVLFLLFDGIVNVMPLLVITLSCIPLLFNNKFTGRLRYLYLLFVPQFVFAMCAKLFSKVFVSKTSIEFLFNFSNLFTDYNKDLSFLLQNMTPGTIFNQFGAYIFWSIYLVLMVVLISYLYEKPIFIMLSFLAGFATIFLLINSGTMFASSNRVFFPCSIFLLIIINAFTIKSKLIWENSFMLGFSMICFINYGTLIAYWMQEGYKIVV